VWQSTPTDGHGFDAGGMTPPMRVTEIVPLPLGVVTVSHLFSHLYVVALPPLFPLIRADLPLSTSQLGLVVTVLAVGTLLQVPVGGLVDHIGARTVAVLGMGLTAMGITIAGAGGSYLWLLAGAAVSGLGQASYHPANYTIIEAVSPSGSLGRSFSIHSFGGIIGFAVAPVLVGTVGLVTDWQIALQVTGLAGLGYTGLMWVLLPAAEMGPRGQSQQSRPFLADVGRIIRSRRMLVMAAFFLLMAAGMSGIMTYTPLYVIDGLGATETIGNIALSVFFGVSSVSVLLGGLLADRADPRLTISVGMGTIIVTLAVLQALSVLQVPWLIAGSFGVAGFGFGLIFASRDRLVSLAMPRGTAGTSFGVVFTIGGVGAILSPVGLGLLIDAFGVASAFIGVMVLLAPAVGVVWLFGDPPATAGG